MRVTLKQLQVFDAVARTGSIGRAAEEIALSQSAVSVALKELESGLGVLLFERHKKRLTLNENGRRLQPRARAVMQQVLELEGYAANAALTGTLRVAAGTTCGTFLLPAICARFSERYPGVVLKLTVTSSTDVLDRVDSMRQDVGIIESMSHRTSLRLTPWFLDEMVVFCAPDHPLAGRLVEPAELGEARWCLPALGSFTRYSMSAALSASQIQIRTHLESNNAEALKRAVAAGAGIGCLSRLAIAAEIGRGELATIGLRGVALERTMNIITRNDVYRGELVDAFIRACMEVDPARA
ncbi:MAG: LysR substrate-binding domain-containing protein [Gammaproteobacteria bacterium]